jgi:putative protein kinase ArgK-like GTPase of G3E family
VEAVPLTVADRLPMRLHEGETEAVGWRVVTLLDAVRQLRDASPGVTGRPRVIAIDGRGGAGKTTLAKKPSWSWPRRRVQPDCGGRPIWTG